VNQISKTRGMLTHRAIFVPFFICDYSVQSSDPQN